MRLTQNGGNNGQITGITDTTGTQEGGRSVTYTYDALHRLKTAETTGTTGYPKWGLEWSYDRYGNRLSQSISDGCVSPMTCPTNSVSVDSATNRLTGSPYVYDENGNMLHDGLNTLTYDAESRVVRVNSSNPMYVYDGAGLWVKKCDPHCTSPTTTTVYIFSGTQVIAEYMNGAAVNSPTREYVYSGSQLVATHEGTSLKFHHQDHLSRRVTSDGTTGSQTFGEKIGDSGHFPYGESWYESGGANKFKFTSYERDSESGNDYAIARSYVSRIARFCSADPLAGSVANPQSLNRYAYVGNDPVNLTDPLGLEWKCIESCVEAGGSRSCETTCEWVEGSRRPEGEISVPISGLVFPLAAPQVPSPAFPQLPGFVDTLPKGPAPPPPACHMMAAYAQEVMDRALAGATDIGKVREQFDREFSKLYVGQSMANIVDAAGLWINNSLPHRTVNSAYLGQTGFQSQFQEVNPNNPNPDQTHHFAAYLSAGMNTWNWGGPLGLAQWAHRQQDNPADAALGAAAFNLGQQIRGGGAVGAAIMRNIRQVIMNRICKK